MTNIFLILVRNVLSVECGASDGGSYDLTDACSKCGTGARRLDPISLPKGRLSDRLAGTGRNELIIPPRLVKHLQRIAPQCLRAIRDLQTRELLSHFELVPEVTLPKWDPRTTGWCTSQIVKPCPACMRDGFFNIPHVPLQLVYSGDLPEFQAARTYEGFGKSALRTEFKESLFAQSPVVVSESIKNVLVSEHGVEFVPVVRYPNGEP